MKRRKEEEEWGRNRGGKGKVREREERKVRGGEIRRLIEVDVGAVLEE